MLTPVWTSHNRVIIRGTSSCLTGDTKICELDTSVLVCEDVRALDVTMDHTLVVQVDEAFEDLRDIHSDEVFWELSKFLAYIVQ